MKNYIVITSINEPSEAIFRFRDWTGWHLIVVGDRKSPAGWACEGVTYLGIDEQYARFGEIARAIPENTYKRKILGYLYAIQNGAAAILESDDDNIPYPDAQACVERDLASSRDAGPLATNSAGWINVYAEFGAPQCWPRGFPLNYLQRTTAAEHVSPKAGPKWGVLQYLADEDPDVDAIFRMTRTERTCFARDRRLRLARGTYSPFNSQATLWLPENYPLLFLPLGVTDRVTDILRGYIALASLWECGQTLAYASPIVFQHRNEHNLLRDFELEIDIYRFADAWSRQLVEAVRDRRTPASAFGAALDAFIALKILSPINKDVYALFQNQLQNTPCCQ